MSVLCSGSYIADILIPDLEEIGPPGSLTYAPQGIHLAPGGHSANVAIDLVQLGQKQVYSIGCIGDDVLGEFILIELKKHGVKTNPQLIKDASTAKNVALIVKGQDRRFIAELKANTMLTPEHLLNTLKTVKPRILYQGTVGGLRYIDAALGKILGVAHEKCTINLVDAIMPTNSWSNLKKAFREIDILHCNQEEAHSLTGLTEIKETINHLTQSGVKLVVISGGNEGLIAGNKSLTLRMPAFKVNEIDPTGAGDALCAGIINALMNHEIKKINEIPCEKLVKILLDGQAAGAACVTGIGATTNVTYDLQHFLLDEQGKDILKATTIT